MSRNRIVITNALNIMLSFNDDHIDKKMFASSKRVCQAFSRYPFSYCSRRTDQIMNKSRAPGLQKISTTYTNSFRPIHAQSTCQSIEAKMNFTKRNGLHCSTCRAVTLIFNDRVKQSYFVWEQN